MPHRVVTLLVVGMVMSIVFPAAAQTGGTYAALTPRNADRMVELAMLTQNQPGALAWTPDGDPVTLAVAGMPGVWLYDIQHLEREPRLLPGEPGAFGALAISTEGQVAAAAGDDAAVRLWPSTSDTGDPRRLEISAGITHLAFNPDGSRLVAVTGSGAVYLADPASGETQHLPDSYPDTPTWLVVGGDVLVVCGDTTLAVWDAHTGVLLRSDAGTGCALHGSQLATVNAAGLVELRDLDTGAVVGTILAGEGVSALAFNATGSLLALGYADGTVTVWDAATATHRRSLMGHTTRILQLAFSGSLLASRDADDTIRLWGIPAFAISSPTDLTVGGRATVHVTGGDVLNVRGGAGLDFVVLDELKNGTPVTVIGGPAYAAGFTWWRVRTPGGVEGWAVDFADDVQTLVPSD